MTADTTIEAEGSPSTTSDRRIGPLSGMFVHTEKKMDLKAKSATPEQLRDMVEHMERRRVHPVLVFGTVASGKSTMLQSMLAYLNRDPDTNIQVMEGAPIVPADFPGAEERILDGTSFVQRSVQDFHLNRKATKTSKPAPFFVPIDLEPHRYAADRNGRISLAFLESMGEWYLPSTYLADISEDQAGAGIFQPFKPEIEAVLRHFSLGLTVIYVGPFATIGNRARRADALAQDQMHAGVTTDAGGRPVAVVGHDPVHDLAIVGSMRQYMELRPNKSRDNHMFLVSKWDLHPPRGVNEPLHGAVEAEELDELLRTNYPQSWAQYSQMMGLSPGAKAFMPYCAGRFIDGAPAPMGQSEPAVYRRFNRTLWNWIYGNARQALDRSDVKSARGIARPPLFDDVAPETVPEGSTGLERLLQMITLSFVLGAPTIGASN